MLIYTLTTLCAILGIGLFILYRTLQRSWANHRADRLKWEQDLKDARTEYKHVTEVLHLFMDAARTNVCALADEVERATGHSDEAAILSNLAHDVMRAKNPFNVVNQNTIAQMTRSGLLVPEYPLHLGQAMKLAVEIDHKARSSERGLYQITRLCRIDEYSSDQARWLAETMSLMQRLCGNDAVEARRKLRTLMDVWEHTTDPHDLEYTLNKGDCNVR